MNYDDLLIEVFGRENLEYYERQGFLLQDKRLKLEELNDLRQRASDAFKFHLTIPDIAVSASAGILLGVGNSVFKGFVPQHGPLRHNHGVTRTPIDYQIPKPEGMSGAVNDLHRQIGPGHDLMRFKEALGLMSGGETDFSLWGKTATDILGHPLKPGNMKVLEFLRLGGFKIPSDPKAELINHLLIDFFTKRSLPIPGSTYLADSSTEMAKIMMEMYKKGLNLKVELGNFLGFTMVQVIIHGYTFLFKAVPGSQFSAKEINLESIHELFSTYWSLTKANNFHGMMMISHGASFLVDGMITAATQSIPAALVQLNYASVLAFSKHLLQYVLQSANRYKELLDQVADKADTIFDVDEMWYADLREHLEGLAKKKELVDLLNRDEWIRQGTIVSDFHNQAQRLLENKNNTLKLLGE